MTMNLSSKAQEILTRLHTEYPGTPVQVYDIARHEKITISQEFMLKYAGKILKENRKYKIIINSLDTPARQRFTIAHELGHYFLHKRMIDRKGITDSAIYRGKLSTAMEYEANQFAAELLMPYKDLDRIIKERARKHIKTSIPILADTFDVSKMAMKIRLGIPT